MPFRWQKKITDMPNQLHLCQSEFWGDLKWSAWFNATKGDRAFLKQIDKLGGFYRLRAKNRDGLVYIGQTGRNLRERISALFRNVFAESTPWNDPHTAAPLLWAYRKEDGYEFEVSFAVKEITTKERQCWEDMLLSTYRQEMGESTLCNHGRLHPYWARRGNRSSGKNTRRRRVPRHYPSHQPCTGITDCSSQLWLGLDWTAFTPLNECRAPKSSGVYRLTDLDNVICYIGEAKNLAVRIKDHAKRYSQEELSISWTTLPEIPKYQLHEIETDLIGAFYKTYRKCPRLQYGQSKKPFREFQQELARAFILICEALDHDCKNDAIQDKLRSTEAGIEPAGELHKILEEIESTNGLNKLRGLYSVCHNAIEEHYLSESLSKRVTGIYSAYKLFCADARRAFYRSSNVPKSLEVFAKQLNEFNDSTALIELKISKQVISTSTARKRKQGRPRKAPTEYEFRVYEYWKRASEGKFCRRVSEFREAEYPHESEKNIKKIIDKVRKHLKRQG